MLPVMAPALWTGMFHPLGLPVDITITELSQAGFAAMETSGTALEINSSGLSKSFAAVLPCPCVLQWADDFNLHYIFGSDAHTPECVGAGYEKAIETLTPHQRRGLVPFLDTVKKSGERP